MGMGPAVTPTMTQVVEFGVTAVRWNRDCTVARRFMMHALIDERGGSYDLVLSFECPAASLASVIAHGVPVWAMQRRVENRYRRCAPILSNDGECVFTVPHVLLLELPVF
jgi:hypothetical protein